MGKVKRQQIVALLIPLFISTLQWTVFGDSDNINCDLNDKNSHCQISTPQECARECRDNEKPRICYYHFTMECHTPLSAECDNGNDTAGQCILADGVEKTVLTINRQFPGPSIQVCKGDRIIVDTETAECETEITIRWHGIFENGFKYYDGVPLLTQSPTGENSTFRYDFVAVNAGTHMYSLVSIQMLDTNFGALIVRDPPQSNSHNNLYDLDLPEHVIIISDWMHELSLERFPGRFRRNTGLTANNFLINSNGINTDPNAFDVAQTTIPTFHVTRGQTYRFRLFNLDSTVCSSNFSIENHNLTIISLDGEDVTPTSVDVITTATGERVDFIINATNEVNSYWITARVDDECDGNVYKLGLLSYDLYSAVNDTPTDGVAFNPADITGCLHNSPDSKCTYQLENAAEEQAPELRKSKPDVQVIVMFGSYFPDLKEFSNDEYHQFFGSPGGGMIVLSGVNNISFADPASPPISQREGYQTLTQPLSPSTNCTESLVIPIPLNSTVEIIIYDALSNPDLDHPFHLHGYSFTVFNLAYHDTINDSKSLLTNIETTLAVFHRQIERGEIKNSPMKDTVVVPKGGYAVIRFMANKPGLWPSNCLVSGMEIVMKVDNI